MKHKYEAKITKKSASDHTMFQHCLSPLIGLWEGEDSVTSFSCTIPTPSHSLLSTCLHYIQCLQLLNKYLIVEKDTVITNDT